MIFRSEGLREATRWRLTSKGLKARVLASTPSSSSLHYTQFEATGFAGVANNISYIVYDPSDELSAFTGEDRGIVPPGIPCKVWRLQRLQRGWYVAQFYTDETWTSCPS